MFGLCARRGGRTRALRPDHESAAAAQDHRIQSARQRRVSAVRRRRAQGRGDAGIGDDPVPQALVITGIVVAFSATALAVALLLRLFQSDRLHDARQSDAPASPRSDPTGRLMAAPPALRWLTTAGGFLLVLSIVVPVAGVLLAFVLGGRHVRRVALGGHAARVGDRGAIRRARAAERRPARLSARRLAAAARRGAARGRDCRRS